MSQDKGTLQDIHKTKKELVRELIDLRRRVGALEHDLNLSRLYEDALAESESRYRGLIENMPIVCFTFDRDGRVVTWNWAAEHVYGYRKEEALGRTVFELIATEQTREATEKVIRGVFQGESFVGLRWQDRNSAGEVGWRVGNAFPVIRGGGEVEAGVSLVIDITAQEQAVESLRESEEKYRELVEKSGSLIMRVDTAGRVTFFNEYAQRFFGFTEREILGRNLVGTIMPEVESTGRDLSGFIEDLCSHPEKYANSENENIRSDGERVWVLWNNRAVTDESGRVNHIFCIGQDITLRRKVEEQLRKLYHAVEQSSSIIVITDARGDIEYVNRTFTRVSGYSAEEVIGQNPRLLKSGEQSADFYRRLWTRIGAGRQWSGEFHNRCKDGTLYWETASITPITNSHGEITSYIKVAEDRTQIRQLEEQLQLRQRMDSLGTLAGGIAHDFNNLLTGIMGNLNLLGMQDSNLSPRGSGYLEEAERCCRRASDLIRQFQGLTRGTVVCREQVDVQQIAAEVFKLLGETTDRLIEKRIEFPRGAFFVEANPTELHQVFLNLGTNAVQAIAERGASQGDFIRLAASNHLSLNGTNSAGLPEGRYVHLQFMDNGVGMSDEVKRRAFEPLFTTRGKEKRGQGLGLSMVYNIICNKHNGFIEIESHPGDGTTFHIFLPAVETAPELAPEIAAPPVRGGNETVMVVDDEEMVRNILRRILESLGYNVLCAADGQDAVEMFERGHDGIDLVILDLTMPRMSGAMAFSRMAELDPLVKVIISTGHTDEDARQGILSRASACVVKPYQAEELARTVRRALDS